MAPDGHGQDGRRALHLAHRQGVQRHVRIRLLPDRRLHLRTVPERMGSPASALRSKSLLAAQFSQHRTTQQSPRQGQSRTLLELHVAQIEGQLVQNIHALRHQKQRRGSLQAHQEDAEAIDVCGEAIPLISEKLLPPICTQQISAHSCSIASQHQTASPQRLAHMCLCRLTGAMAAGVPTKVLSRTKEPKSHGPVDSRTCSFLAAPRSLRYTQPSGPRHTLLAYKQATLVLGNSKHIQVHAAVWAQAHAAGPTSKQPPLSLPLKTGSRLTLLAYKQANFSMPHF